MRTNEKVLETSINMLVLGGVYFYIFKHIPLAEIMANTVVTGGDTGSHYPSAAYLRDYLLPHGKLIGWIHGNYGGFPKFIMYFPFLYILAVLGSFAVPLTVSFKIVTLIGPLLLPLTVFLFVNRAGFRFPSPILAALSSLLFLFNTSNSMWGGNFYSTLAGEFSYAVSFALIFWFWGELYRLCQLIDQEKQPSLVLDRRLIVLILLLFVIGTTHGFTLILATISASYFLIGRNGFLKKLIYLTIVFGLGGLLFAGWFMQLFFNIPYTTAFNILWTFSNWWEVIPQIMIPNIVLFILLSIYALVPGNLKWQILTTTERKVVPFIWFLISFCTLAYFSSETLNLPDIRFIPFIYLLILIWSSALLGRILYYKAVQRIFPLLGLVAVLLWISYFPNDIKQWQTWNYKGYEKAPSFSAFRAINYEVMGNHNDTRVVYEHNQINNALGTVRAFENLPYYAGRSTLEGLYFQSSLLSPFVFYLQSLYSKEISCPFPDYACSNFDLKRARDYFELMNVDRLILVSDEAKKSIREHKDFYQLQKNILYSPYEIWKLQIDTGYIKVLPEEPEWFEAGNFRSKFYHWFRNYQKSEPHLITLPKANARIYGLDQIPTPAPKSKDLSLNTDDLTQKDCIHEDLLLEESIEFSTRCLGRPHLIKVAYNPAWRVEGAIGPYLASPAFMIVYPLQEKVRLVFDNRGPRLVGISLNYLGLFLFIGLAVALLVKKRAIISEIFAKIPPSTELRVNKVFHFFFVILFLVFIGFIIYDVANPGYQGTFKQVERYYTYGNYKKSQIGFQEIIDRWSDQPTIDKVYYFLGLSFYLDQQCDKGIEQFKKIFQFKDSEYIGEGYYHVGLCNQFLGNLDESYHSYQVIINELKDPQWTKHAKDRLSEFPPNFKPKE